MQQSNDVQHQANEHGKSDAIGLTNYEYEGEDVHQYLRSQKPSFALLALLHSFLQKQLEVGSELLDDLLHVVAEVSA